MIFVYHHAELTTHTIWGTVIIRLVFSWPRGVPALASPLPSYREIIEKTGGGRICESDKEWENAFDEILEDRKMLWEWSQSAYEGMKEYSTESVVKQYISLFEKLHGA